MTVTRQEHPEVLDGRSAAGVVEIHDVQPFAGDEHVARVEIAVQANQVHLARAIHGAFDAFDDLVGHARVCGQQLVRNEVLLEQVIARIDRVALNVDPRSVLEFRDCADEVDAGYESAELLEEVEVVKFRGPAAAPGIDRNAKVARGVQGAAVDRQRRHDRDLLVGELLRECVFLQDRLIAPTIGAIELGDDGVVITNADLVDAVLVAVECEQPTIAVEAELVECVEKILRLQLGVGQGGAVAVHRADDTLRAFRQGQVQLQQTTHRRAVAICALVAALTTGGGCESGASGIDAEAHTQEVLEWREGRLDRLKAPGGFLNLAGLFWLTEETTTFGAAEDNDIVFPSTAAHHGGEFRLSPEGVVMVANPEADIRSSDEAVDTILIADDTTDSPVTISHGSLAWNVIKRDGRFAVRLRDFEHPALESFPPLEYFPIDPAWRIKGRLERYVEPRIANVSTVIEGLGYNPESPGVVVFELAGQRFELEAYASGERLFFVFGDESNGRETYPAGRFLYAEMPGDDGATILDFNKSYSPPCAFNDFSTCPVASPRNRLATKVSAGELFNPDAYMGTTN